jgi:hypothetical protein
MKGTGCIVYKRRNKKIEGKSKKWKEGKEEKW